MSMPLVCYLTSALFLESDDLSLSNLTAVPSRIPTSESVVDVDYLEDWEANPPPFIVVAAVFAPATFAPSTFGPASLHPSALHPVSLEYLGFPPYLVTSGGSGWPGG
jgi:hypothetical protein